MAESVDIAWNGDLGTQGASVDGYEVKLELGRLSKRVIVTVTPPGGGTPMVGGCADIPAAQEFAREMIAEHRREAGDG
jgi:hypothetical protein